MLKPTVKPFPETLLTSEVLTSDEVSLLGGTDNLPQGFIKETDYVEWFILDSQFNTIYQNNNYQDFSVLNKDTITLDPTGDLEKTIYNEGQVYSSYNVLRRLFFDTQDKPFIISQISSDRTEIRLSYLDVANETLEILYNIFNIRLTEENNFSPFHLNFGNNQLLLAVNYKFDATSTPNSSLLIKLQNPLPLNLKLNTKGQIVQKLSDSPTYLVSFPEESEFEEPKKYLSSPNFTIPQLRVNSTSTDAISLSSITNSTSNSRLNSYITGSGIKLNIDYSSFNNFTHYSSARRRVDNFISKVINIESASIVTTGSIGGDNRSSALKQKDILEHFDGYEYYLYYDQNLTSSQANFTPTQVSASNYDDNNLDTLQKSLPKYIKDDSTNLNLLKFLDMLGQSFDEQWVATKEISNRYNTDHRLDRGLPKELVAEAIKSFGLKVYESQINGNNNLYSSLLGLDIPSSVTGSRTITNYVSSSTNLTLNDVQQSIYKRVYHNLPYLLKTKGTKEGLRTLSNIYGVPSTILQVNEFGGKDKTQRYNREEKVFNYDLKTLRPIVRLLAQTASMSMRVKMEVPKSSSVQTIMTFAGINTIIGTNTPIPIRFDVSYSISPPTHSGSYQDLTLGNYFLVESAIPEIVLASGSFPIFDSEWCSLFLDNGKGTQETIITFMSAKSSTPGNNKISYEVSNSIPFNLDAATLQVFNGSFQEIRAYTDPTSKQFKDDVTLNPTLTTSSIVTRGRFGTGVVRFPSSSANVNKTNVEYYWYNEPYAPLDNVLSSNINIIDTNLSLSSSYKGEVISGKVLSSNERLESISTSSAISSNTLEVGFSPTTDIDKDIINQGITIEGKISNPNNRFLKRYPQLQTQFKSFISSSVVSSSNPSDYINQVEQMDSSLFKMVEDFTPFKESLLGDIIIKNPILVRNKQAEPEVSMITSSLIEAVVEHKSGSSTIHKISGGGSGVITPNTSSHITGDISGSNIVASNGELNKDNTVKISPTILLGYNIQQFNRFPTDRSINTITPLQGQIYVYNKSSTRLNSANQQIGEFESTQILIHNTTSEGIDISNGIANLKPGDSIEFPIVTIAINSVRRGGFDKFIIKSVAIFNANSYVIEIERIFVAGVLAGSGTNLRPSFTAGDVNLDIKGFINQPNYDYNDYNPLLNNGSVNRSSKFIKEVEYLTDPDTPTNITALINGNAIPALIQDSNYTSKPWTDLRYNGVKNTINRANIGGGLNQQILAGNYIGYFSEIKNTGTGTGSLHLQYLFDVNGRMSKIDYNTQTINTLKSNFTQTNTDNFQSATQFNVWVYPIGTGSFTQNKARALDVDPATGYLSFQSQLISGVNTQVGPAASTQGGLVAPRGFNFTQAQNILAQAEQTLREKRIIS